MKTNKLDLRAGDTVQVKPLAEILTTLDADGCLEGMPFMPEMARYCGRRMRVFRRAHKTCDTVEGLGGRSVDGGAVHLEDARCDGSAHGECHNSCMLFWKEAWLNRSGAPPTELAGSSRPDETDSARAASSMPVRWLYQVGPDAPPDDIRWRCQATEAPKFTKELPPYHVSQYIEDLTSRNIDLKEFLAGTVHTIYRHLLEIGLGYRVLVAIHDWIQARRGGIPHPYIQGTLTKTPVEVLDLQVGERVRIKPFQAIMSTVDSRNKNRGLWFVPQEMGRFCGREAIVVKRIERLISERTGEMLPMKTPSVMLGGIYCTGRTVDKRVFCPRASALFWREIWLERIGRPRPDQAAASVRPVDQAPEVARTITASNSTARCCPS